MTATHDGGTTSIDIGFRHGVASGDPTVDSVLIWTSWSGSQDGETRLRWEVATDESFDDVVASGLRDATDGADGVLDHEAPVNVRVEGLTPATTYHYRFVTDGLVSPVGRTATLPPVGSRPDHVRLGIACCSRLASAPFDAYGALAASSPDLVVHVGDYIYEDEATPHDPPRPCVEPEDYRRRYSQFRSQDPLMACHAAAPWVSVWDDHEVADDSWDGGSPSDATPDRRAAFERRRHAAALAYLDWMPQEVSDTGPTLMDRRVRYGDLLDVVVLDARQASRERPVGESGPALVDPTDPRRCLSDDQWEWLETCAAESSGWFVLATQTQVGELRLARLPNPRRRLALQPFVNPAQWDGYPRERERLARTLAPVADRALICSGDLHGRFHTALGLPGGGRIPEITTPSIASTPFAEAIRGKVPIPTPVLRRWLGWLNPHIEYMDLESRGSTVLDVTPLAIEVTALVRGRAEPQRFRIERGSSSIRPA